MPVTMEAGYDVGDEKLKGVLMAPLFASVGLTWLALAWGQVGGVLAVSVMGVFAALFGILGWFILFAKSRRVWFAALGINLLLMILGLVGYWRFVVGANRGG